MGIKDVEYIEPEHVYLMLKDRELMAYLRWFNNQSHKRTR